MMKDMLEWEKGYVAGMIDGEGTIDLNHHRKYKGAKLVTTPRLRISNTNKSALERIVQLAGAGRVSISNKAKGNHKTRYEYYLGPKGGLKHLLEQVKEYLAIKREDAEAALARMKARMKQRIICERDNNGRFKKWIRVTS